jgi:phosphatidylinositol alpha 1,6-mannosyltransferase
MRARLLDGRPASSMIVLYVGRLANEKRVDLLRQVAQVPGVAVAIVGDGPTRPDLEQLFGHTATFLGFLTGEELAQAYASADVFGFTGTNEVAGQVVKEAMASGLPVLVPDSGGIVDYVMEGVNGHVCAIDSAAYAAQVVRLRDNPARRRQMGQNALAYARRLSWEDSMAELEKLYAEAVHLNARQQRLRDRLRTRMRSAAGALVPRLRPN